MVDIYLCNEDAFYDQLNMHSASGNNGEGVI